MNSPIYNAKDRPLANNTGTLPDVSGAMLDYFQPMTFTTIVKTVVNFQAIETPTSTSFMGVIQPFSPQQILLKPEGQRAWKWFTVHATIGLNLVPDEVITYLGVQYRVMARLDYTQYGYNEYHLVQDWTGAGP